MKVKSVTQVVTVTLHRVFPVPDERSEDILERLLAAGVGRRPVIFVGHSMGGLIIKKILVAAQNSGNEAKELIAKNTKGVVTRGWNDFNIFKLFWREIFHFL